MPKPLKNALCAMQPAMRSESASDAAASPIRLIALDVDGTLLNSNHEISEGNRRAIHAAVEAGLRIVLASARSPGALRPLLADLGISGYVVAYGGGLVCQLDNASTNATDVIANHCLSLVSAHEIVRFALGEGISLGWFVGEDWHIPAWDVVLRRETEIIQMQPQVTLDLMTLPLPPHKIQCMVASDSEIKKLENLLSILPDDCIGQFSHPTYLEIIAKGVDKAVGLKQLGHRLGISLHEMAAIGDGENDLGMLKAVGLGIAMANAPSHVSRDAKRVTTSNDQDGVAVAIGRILADLPKNKQS
jgi:Cof subfamily protein (haloacid dehalogenase superfamily)